MTTENPTSELQRILDYHISPLQVKWDVYTQVSQPYKRNMGKKYSLQHISLILYIQQLVTISFTSKCDFFFFVFKMNLKGTIKGSVFFWQRRPKWL